MPDSFPTKRDENTDYQVMSKKIHKTMATHERYSNNTF